MKDDQELVSDPSHRCPAIFTLHDPIGGHPELGIFKNELGSLETEFMLSLVFSILVLIPIYKHNR
jgi:hypothetical protein